MLAPTRWSRSALLNLTLITLSFVHQSTSTCYDWNGKEKTSEWAPCQADSGVITTCCASNRTAGFGENPGKSGQNSDRCLSNGLCQNEEYKASSPDKGQMSYWRNGCTSASPDNKRCLSQVCADGGDYNFNGAAMMTPCDQKNPENSTFWCCGISTSCCGTTSQWELPTFLGDAVPALGRIVSQSSSTPSSTSSPTSSSSSSSATTSLSSPKPSGQSGTQEPAKSAEDDASSNSSGSNLPDKEPTLAPGAIAGIVIACVVAILALVAVILLKRRWNQKRRALEDKVIKARNAQEMNQNASYEYWGQRLDTSSPPLEKGLDDDRCHELHSESTTMAHEIGLDVSAARSQEVKNMI